jgi:CMP-N-acetylneuraminic acid synthetase
LEHPYYAWRIESGHLVPFFTIEHQKMVRQELPPVYVENGSIYIIRRQVLETGRIYGKRIAPYVMDHDSSLDIDAPSDLQWAEYLLARRREQE